MSKNNRRLESFSEKHKERKVNALSELSTIVSNPNDLSTVVDVASLPVVVEQQISYPVVEELPAETGDPETAETGNLENYEGSGDVQEFPDEPVTAAVAEQVAESNTVEEAAAAFHEVQTESDVAPAEPPDVTAINVLDQVEPQPDPIDPPPAETEKIEEPVAAKEIPKAALELIEALQAQINLLKTSKASRKVASGSKARPNVTYTLLAKPPAWHSTPQVAQLQQILFNEAFLAAHRGEDGTVKVSEPELFAQVAAGHAAGILRTRQEPVRIFQYYRSDLLNANCLRWQ